MNKSEISKKYRVKYGADMPTLKLARIMYKENNLAFKTLEDARNSLRYIEGKTGKTLRKWVAGSPFVKTEARPLNPYNLPESYSDTREPYRLPKECTNILLISDLHIPYHDINAITIALDYGKKNNIDTIFINGDLIDFARISKFEPDLNKRRTKEEFDAAESFLQTLRSEWPHAKIYWLKGNHCIRLENWLATKASEIWDDPYFHLEQRLRLKEKKITILDDKVLVKAGKLSITHGHHIFKGVFVPVSPARGAFLRAKQSVIVGHLHRASHHPEITLDGEIISCWSTACLCELRPNYSPMVSNSQHGFAHILVEKNGNYTVKNYQIIKGQIH